MNPRLRLWWDCLPFTVKATLIALITGVVVTATARAATEDNDPTRSALLTLHHPRVVVSDDDASAPTATITLASFEGDLTEMLQPTAMRERPGRDDRVHGRRAASARRRLSQVDPPRHRLLPDPEQPGAVGPGRSNDRSHPRSS